MINLFIFFNHKSDSSLYSNDTNIFNEIPLINLPEIFYNDHTLYNFKDIDNNWFSTNNFRYYLLDNQIIEIDYKVESKDKKIRIDIYSIKSNYKELFIDGKIINCGDFTYIIQIKAIDDYDERQLIEEIISLNICT